MKPIKIIIISILFLSLSFNFYGFYVSNQSCKAFPNQCTNQSNEEKVSGQNLNISQLIMIAGGFYLQSHSDYKLLLKKIEISHGEGINFNELTSILNNSIFALNNANLTYLRLLEMSQIMEYDPVVIEELKNFDYSTYQINNNLIPPIFKIVESYLKNGDVRGVYLKLYNDTDRIKEKLTEIKKKIDKYAIPEISILWRLNQFYIEFDLFGQYTSEVFINI